MSQNTTLDDVPKTVYLGYLPINVTFGHLLIWICVKTNIFSSKLLGTCNMGYPSKHLFWRYTLRYLLLRYTSEITVLDIYQSTSCILHVGWYYMLYLVIHYLDVLLVMSVYYILYYACIPVFYMLIHGYLVFWWWC